MSRLLDALTVAGFIAAGVLGADPSERLSQQARVERARLRG